MHRIRSRSVVPSAPRARTERVRRLAWEMAHDPNCHDELLKFVEEVEAQAARVRRLVWDSLCNSGNPETLLQLAGELETMVRPPAAASANDPATEPAACNDGAAGMAGKTAKRRAPGRAA